METRANLIKALINFQGEMKPLILDRDVTVKTKDNRNYTFSYATFKNIIKSCQSLLMKNGLAITQLVGENGAVTTMLLHESGEFLQTTFKFNLAFKTMQGLGSAISYAKRYSYAAILGLVADDDDDGNVADENQYEYADRIGNGEYYNQQDIHKKLDKVMEDPKK